MTLWNARYRENDESVLERTDAGAPRGSKSSPGFGLLKPSTGHLPVGNRDLVAYQPVHATSTDSSIGRPRYLCGKTPQFKPKTALPRGKLGQEHGNSGIGRFACRQPSGTARESHDARDGFVSRPPSAQAAARRPVSN